MESENPEVNRFQPVLQEPTVVLTVDVEDYFMSPECIPVETWPDYQSAIHKGMERCLNLFDRYKAKGTFFFVAWLAERYPELVEWTVQAGHEIGTHSYDHTFVTELDEKEFAAKIEKSLEILRSLVPNQTVVGHRAPAFSLERKKKWQFEILRENGIEYDSSINPHQTYLYGEKHAPRHPYPLHGLIEIPPASIECYGKRLPVGGGGTLRILPEMYLAWARKRYQEEGFPPVIYIHPWEFVPEHPKTVLPWKLRVIHWLGIKSTQIKIEAILRHNKIITMKNYYNQLVQQC